MNSKQCDAKKCLDKLRKNPAIKEIDKFKQRRLVILCLNLAIHFASSIKADINALENLIDCFNFIIEHFFNVFDFKDENYVKYFCQMLNLLYFVVLNDKEHITEYSKYAKKVIENKEIDNQMNGMHQLK